MIFMYMYFNTRLSDFNGHFLGSLHLRPLLLRPLYYKIETAALTAPNKREGTAVLPGATKIPF